MPITSTVPLVIVHDSASALANPSISLGRTVSDLPNRFGSALRIAMTATSKADVTASMLPTAELTLGSGPWQVHTFRSDWGDEFTPETFEVTAASSPVRIQTRRGRASKDTHPWVSVTDASGGCLIVAPAWSGNWFVDLTPAGEVLTITAGINPWKFTRRITPERPFVAPDVVVAWAADERTAAAALADAVGRHILARTPWSDALPIEWNHWWPYEDAEIDHETFVANAAVAHELGCRVATLDAGWFGRSAEDSFWERERGDWHLVNDVRFPRGLTDLADEVRALGVEFGIWIEAEAIGTDAQIATLRPDIVARRVDASVPERPASPPLTTPTRTGAIYPESNTYARGDELYGETVGSHLGYVCLGSPGGRAFVRESLESLVDRTGCRWIKLDFNLDPWAGCNRTDHGHEAGDGLYEHYHGLYQVLDEFTAAHPQIILESCSSGGLRIDLGLAERVHCFFLSDPDWTEFQLQLLWGASALLPAAGILHWSESQWRTFHPCQNLDVDTVTNAQFDQSLRAVMVHRMGISLKLIDLPERLRCRLADHLKVANELAPIVRDGVIRPLTAQPRRDGKGHRFPAFQLGDGERIVIAAFALDGAAPSQVVTPNLDPASTYRIGLLGPDADYRDLPLTIDAENKDSRLCRGSDLARGFLLQRTSDATSWLMTLTPVPADPAAHPTKAHPTKD